jgi:hypothetical protein
MDAVKPQAEHEWLQQLVGEWTFEGEASMGPDQPPMKSQGTESVRTLGGLWVLCELQSSMPGGEPGTMLFTFGYDPQKQRFVGTFLGSMMTNLWIYEGSLDADRKLLTLDTEGPSFTDPAKLAKYQDSIEIVSPDHRILRSQFLGEDGKWNPFMTAHYRRK